CVSTSSIEKPASYSRARATRANSGVPAKATLTKCGSATFVNPPGGRRRSRLGAPSYLHLLARLLDHLRLDAVALQRAEVLDEDLAHQVIHLVLHAHREQAFSVEFIDLAVAVECAHAHAGMALHLVVDLRHRQATLVGEAHLVAGPHQLGVD